MFPWSPSNRSLPDGHAVVFVTLAYHPLIGGTETQVRQLAERWAAAGQPVWVVTRSIPGRPREEQLCGVRLVRLPSVWLPGLSWLTFGAAALAFFIRRRLSIGWLVLQGLNVALFPTVLYSRMTGVPLFIRLTAGGVAGNIRALKRTWLGAAIVRCALCACDNVIAITEEIVSEVLAEGFSSERIRRIPNGVDLDRFSKVIAPERQAEREVAGVAENAFVVLFVGRLDPLKNLSTFLHAWSLFVQRQANAVFVIAGEGSERQRFETLAASLGIQSSIRMVGEVSDARLWYVRSDLLVLPSVMEGLSNVLLEAMASELPILSSRVGGAIDLFSGWADDTLLAPMDIEGWAKALHRLSHDSKRRQDLATEGRQIVESQYSLERSLAAYQRLLLERPSPGRPS